MVKTKKQTNSNNAGGTVNGNSAVNLVDINALPTAEMTSTLLAEIILAAVDKFIAVKEREIACLKTEISNLQLNIAFKDTEIKDLQQRVDVLEEQVDANSAYERRETLIISGNIPAATINGNCSNIVTSLLKNDVKLQLRLDDISTADRIGKKPISHAPDKRSIIFKLCRRDLKYDILNACKESKPSFYIQ